MKRFLFSLFVASACFATDRLEFTRNDGSKVVGYIDAPTSDSFPIAIVLQGSQRSSVKGMHDEWKERLLAIGYGVATVEKKGIEGEEIDGAVYDEANSVDQRIADHLVLLDQLRLGAVAKWNKRVALIGTSEGGEVGGAVAALTPETEAVILFCSGGGWTRMEEILWSFRKQMADENLPPLYIQSTMAQSRDALYYTLENPSSKLRSFGLTNKYWASAMKHRLLESLNQTKCPLYIVQGGQDDRVPPSSSDFLVKTLKDQGRGGITYQMIESLGHDPRTNPVVFDDAVSWLKQIKK